MNGNWTGQAITTAQEQTIEDANRARRIATVLRHDLTNNPPADARVLAEAEARCQRYERDANEKEAAIRAAMKHEHPQCIKDQISGGAA